MIIINSFIHSVVTLPPQNLLKFSRQFQQADWSGISDFTVTPDVIAGPDGTTTADLFKAGNGSFGGLLRQGFTFEAREYTASVYLKKDNHDYIALRNGASYAGGPYAFMNLSTGDSTGITGVTTYVQTLADGWFRFAITFTSTAGTTVFDIAICNSSGVISGTTAGTEKVYIWGAQLNTGALRDYTDTESTNVP